MSDAAHEIVLVAGRRGVLSVDVQVTAMTKDTADAMVAAERARSLWPVVVMCAALVLIASAILTTAILSGGMSVGYAIAIALMVAPASAATAWKVLGRSNSQ
jgi:hypothetical protein